MSLIIKASKHSQDEGSHDTIQINTTFYKCNYDKQIKSKTIFVYGQKTGGIETYVVVICLQVVSMFICHQV